MKLKLLFMLLSIGGCGYSHSQTITASDSLVKSKKYVVKINESFTSVKEKIGQLRNDNYNPRGENTYYSVSDELIKWKSHLVSKTIIIKFNKEEKLSFFKIVYTMESCVNKSEMMQFIKQKINEREIYCNDFVKGKKLNFIKQDLGITHKWAIEFTKSYSRFYYSVN